MSKPILIAVSLMTMCIAVTGQQDPCEYFHLPRPNEVPQSFNPEVLDLNGYFKFNVEIKSCDEIYFTVASNGESIYFSKRVDSEWTAPERASFSDPEFNDADPFLTKDGSRMYFISKRPTSEKDENLDWNIWYTDKQKDGWGAPQPLPEPVNSKDFDEYFFSISDSGNAYFSSNRKGGEGSFDIYTVKILGKNKYSKPKNVGQPVSTSKYEFDPYISPDERLIIFSINEDNGSSLYYSFKDKSGYWTEPHSLGDDINISNQDFAPSLSHDGKYIFYSNDGVLKWVSVEKLNIPD